MIKKRILIIEDDSDVADIVGIFLSRRDFEVFTAVDGREGVAMARAKFPNLILLDVMLPDMDGFDVCKILRTTILTQHIPIMFLTQRDRRADKVNGLELGADDYITKPFDMEELHLRVQSALNRSSREALYDPRSGLPTRSMALEAIENLRGVHRLDLRLSGMDHFRDIYGFMPTDEILHFVGLLIADCLATYGTPADFAGSLNDEHHIIMTYAENPDELIRALADRFARESKPFYGFTDADRGYMMNQQGETFPLMGIAISRVYIQGVSTLTPRTRNAV